ncbi:MAG: PLP-dependent aminotransferase family protein [Cellulomonadaceae bacterium]
MITPTEVAELVRDPSPAGIAAALGRAVRTGRLSPGERLPTVRDLAAALGVSPATVSGAWGALTDAGLIRSRGRAGTYVLSQTSTWLPPRYRDLAAAEEVPYRLDLSSGTPDPQLLPALGPAFARLGRRTEGATTSSYLGPPVIGPLEGLLRARWPFEAEAITVVDGALDGLSRTLDVLVGLGARVALEVPGFPPLFDLLDTVGAERVPVAVDAHGMRPAALAAALDAQPAVVLLQPRAHNPTGASLTPERAAELAHVLRTHPHGADVVVVEDDHSGAICQTPVLSVGTHLPGQVVRVHSYSKSHGPDLRIAALGGPARIVEAISARRMLGPGWTSRMLQTVLLELLTDQAAIDTVARARSVYRRRGHEVAAAVRAAGGRLEAGDGLNMWLPVADERAAIVYLAAQGIRAAPGTPFVPDPAWAGAHLRLSLGQVRGGFAELGTALAAAARRR